MNKHPVTLRYYSAILGLADGSSEDQAKLKNIAPNMPQQYYMEIQGKKRRHIAELDSAPALEQDEGLLGFLVLCYVFGSCCFNQPNYNLNAFCIDGHCQLLPGLFAQLEKLDSRTSQSALQDQAAKEGEAAAHDAIVNITSHLDVKRRRTRTTAEGEKQTRSTNQRMEGATSSSLYAESTVHLGHSDINFALVKRFDYAAACLQKRFMCQSKLIMPMNEHC